MDSRIPFEPKLNEEVEVSFRGKVLSTRINYDGVKVAVVELMLNSDGLKMRVQDVPFQVIAPWDAEAEAHEMEMVRDAETHVGEGYPN